MLSNAAVVVPVKSLDHAKGRLESVLDARGRRRLARWMADRVLRAAAGMDVFVVCDDAEVEEWALGCGARTVFAPGVGLNGAVDAAVRVAASFGHRRLIVAHADLPLIDSFDPWIPGESADDHGLITADRFGDGTNVMSLPASVVGRFRFRYGRGSFEAHRTELARLDIACDVVSNDAAAWDVDRPADLDFDAGAAALPADLAALLGRARVVHSGVTSDRPAVDRGES